MSRHRSSACAEVRAHVEAAMLAMEDIYFHRPCAANLDASKRTLTHAVQQLRPIVVSDPDASRLPKSIRRNLSNFLRAYDRLARRSAKRGPNGRGGSQ